jgi:hypothetical protein
VTAEDYDYVVFTCPVCESHLRFCREDRWGQTLHTVVCLKPLLGGYLTCEQQFVIETANGKTYVKTREGRPLAARLVNLSERERQT